MNSHFDLIIIGAGAGGYTAAERAGAAGKRVLLIEKAQLGGVCINRGCIPAKTLYQSAKIYRQLQETDRFGVHVDSVRFDMREVIARKGRIVAQLRDGVRQQIERRGGVILEADARLIARKAVRAGDVTYTAERILIASGASPVIPTLPGIDLAHVVTPTELFDHDTLPSALVILGGTPIALNLAAIYTLAGSKVTLITEQPGLLPDIDEEIRSLLLRDLNAIDFHFSAQVKSITEKYVRITDDNRMHDIPADLVLICGERAPNVAGLGLEEAGIDYDTRIHVDEYMRTNLPGVYAIGDVTGISMWAHSAARMAQVAVNHMFGTPDRFRIDTVPFSLHTYPEIAAVGLTEATAKARGIPVRVARLPLTANASYLIENDQQRGLCKIVVDQRTNVVLGVHLYGGECSSIVVGAAAMLEDEFRVQDVQQMIFAHPTLSEVLRDTLYELR